MIRRIELISTVVTDCRAESGATEYGQGGAFFVSDGTVLLSNATMLVNNSASGAGATMLAEGGVTTYSLPAPPGRWIAGQGCDIFRASCPRDIKGSVLDPRCTASRLECSLLQNTTAFTAAGVQCQPLLLNQPW